VNRERSRTLQRQRVIRCTAPPVLRILVIAAPTRCVLATDTPQVIVYHSLRWRLLVPCVLGCSLLAPARAQKEAPPSPVPGFGKVQQRGVDYLVKTQPDGIFEQKDEPQC